MPAYTSITFTIPRPVQPDLIEQFYRLFISDGISFKSVFNWSVGEDDGKPEDKTLDQIIEWNQKQAELITPADDEGYMGTDAWQVCLDIQDFYECRLIQSCRAEDIWIYCIVPEGEVSVESISVIEKAALRVWGALPVNLVETSGEMDSCLGYALVSKGVQPSVMPFAILDDKCAPLASTIYFEHEKLSRGVILRARIKDKKQVLLDEGTERYISKLEIGRIYHAIRPQLEVHNRPDEEIFTSEYIEDHSIEDAVKALVKLAQSKTIKMVDTDINQLAFIAKDFAFNFRSPHLKGTWIDYD